MKRNRKLKQKKSSVRMGFALHTQRNGEWFRHPFLFDSRPQAHAHLDRMPTSQSKYRILGVRVDATPTHNFKDQTSAVQ